MLTKLKVIQPYYQERNYIMINSNINKLINKINNLSNETMLETIEPNNFSGKASTLAEFINLLQHQLLTQLFEMQVISKQIDSMIEDINSSFINQQENSLTIYNNANK